ncbi:MAG: LysM peptidoglycan-binding domain-containing protein [Bacteroidetes bacterium]|nr:LysM peptidoglycan-binding domain-containing protein [Bacteroidota bacterium]
MKFILGVLFCFLINVLSAQEYVKVEILGSKKYYIYVIEEGVSLESLSEDFFSTKELIIASNPGVDKNFTVGRKLMIPVKLKEILHEVKESETLYSLCKKYCVPVETFKSDTSIVGGNIKIGQILKFVDATTPVYYNLIRKNGSISDNQPNSTQSENDSIIEYKVNQGETLYSISKRYMVSSEKIQKLNNITPVQLKTGMILKIPLKREILASTIKIKSIDSLTILNKVDSTLLFPSKKGPWKIAMFLPFYLGNSSKAPASVVSASTEFFMGAKMAVDQIGSSTELYVYDYMTDTIEISKILLRPEFSTMDLVFAPLDVGEALVVANWCQNNSVPFVTTVPKANRLISNNPMAHFGIPSDAHMLKELARYAIKNYSTKQVILVKSNQVVDKSNYDAFRNVYYSDENPTNIKLIEATTKNFGQYLAKDPRSIVVFSSNEKNEVIEFVNLLKPYSGLTLFGHKDWLKYGDAVSHVRGKYNLHYVNYNSPFPSFNYHAPAVKSLHRTYRSYYNADITGMVIYGYDIVKYFTSYILLRREANGVIMDFDLQPNFDSGGFENIKCFIER